MTPTPTEAAAAALKRAFIMHLEITDELPTLDELRQLAQTAETTTGKPLRLADILRATRDAVTDHADAQTGNALDIMRNALNHYEQIDVQDKAQATYQRQRMQTALDTLKTMEILRL
jgi:hypothetical protein